MTKLQPQSVAFSVEEWEWDELYEDTEDRSSRHPIHRGVNIKAQLHIWPNLIQRAWNNMSPENLKELSEFGVSEAPADPCVISLKEDSSLCLIYGISQKVKRLTWRTDSRKQTLDTLLDCGVPIVLSEDVKTNDPSEYVSKEGEHLIAVCFLWGDLTHSTSLFNSPIVCKVKKTLELPRTLPARLIIADLQPESTRSDLEHELYYDRMNTIAQRSQPKRFWRRLKPNA